ncbi:hypothetical protein GP486_004232 [Trichoglossum hirsutum]|uniref:polynucleotide adenylyltransferase n=1 Tax=Trichoglossum hirsutum TaxID=265104 RepID=A0A9P8LB76_9PEZI|nr:hypothetical protein GP486_004232 [Trichoglossum hirsutum]
MCGNRWSEINRLAPSDPLFNLSITSLKKLNAFRDMDYLQRTIPDLPAFRMAHRFIKVWAQRRGIYSARFGYLGGIHITLLLSRLCKLLFRDAGAITAADIICTFFSHYSKFDWKTDISFDPFFHKQRPRYQRSATREPAVILSLHAPAINVAHAASFPSVRIFAEELERAGRLLLGPSITWEKLIEGDKMGLAKANLPSGAAEFLESYSSYIKIDVQYWGASLSKGSALVGWVESRCVLLLVDLNRRLPEIHARIWPARFAHEDTTDATTTDDLESKEYHGCYLIGLAKGESATTANAAELASRKKLAQGVLRQVLEKFTEQIQGDEKYFDAKTSWVEVTHVKQAGLGTLSLDTREWGNFTEEVSDSDADEDEGEEEETGTAALPHRTLPATPTARTSSKSKLRPAQDILHRLLWDASLDVSDHVIGYLDRFSGTKEMPVERWKTEKTDEEFVPMHRVVYFRRKSDGVRVWDREGRWDGVFGSGKGSVA